MRISKWGDALAVRLPQDVVDELGLKEGDEIAVTKVKAGAAAVCVEKPVRTHELLKKLREYRIDFPSDYKFDREEANARRTWDDP